MSVAAGVADEERGMLDSLVDDKATAGAQEPPDDVHTERFGNLGVDLNSPYARTPMAPMVGQSGDASWRRFGKRQGWQESARTHNRSAGSL